jgi:hypothetical protein
MNLYDQESQCIRVLAHRRTESELQLGCFSVVFFNLGGLVAASLFKSARRQILLPCSSSRLFHHRSLSQLPPNVARYILASSYHCNAALTNHSRLKLPLGSCGMRGLAFIYLFFRHLSIIICTGANKKSCCLYFFSFPSLFVLHLISCLHVLINCCVSFQQYSSLQIATAANRLRLSHHLWRYCVSYAQQTHASILASFSLSCPRLC